VVIGRSTPGSGQDRSNLQSTQPNKLPLNRFAHQGDNELGAEALVTKGLEQGRRVSLLGKGL